MFVWSMWLICVQDNQSEFQMFTLFSSRLTDWRTIEEHQRGGSMLGSVNVRGTLRRVISTLAQGTHLKLGELSVLYLSSIISQFPEIIH